MDTPTASVIIPVFNYSARVAQIVAEAKQSPFVKEIILVDDGSNKKTQLVLQRIPGVTLVTHAVNLGKAAALRTGLENSSHDIIVFIDEDLVHFSHTHLDALIRPVVEGRFDATISDREHEWWLTKWTGFPSAYSGERVVKRSIIASHPEMFRVHGFEIEPSMNKILFRKYSVAKVFFPGVGQVAKLNKRGIAGLVADGRMFLQIVQFLGMKELLFQLYFVRKILRLSV